MDNFLDGDGTLADLSQSTINDNFPKPLGKKGQDSSEENVSGNDSELDQLLNSDNEDEKESSVLERKVK
jgi:hypothetical protein